MTRYTAARPEIVFNVDLEMLGPVLYATDGQQKLNFHTYILNPQYHIKPKFINLLEECISSK
jgi:hypothetical protein